MNGHAIDRRAMLRVLAAGGLLAGTSLLVLRRPDGTTCVRAAGCDTCGKSGGCRLPEAILWREVQRRGAREGGERA